MITQVDQLVSYTAVWYAPYYGRFVSCHKRSYTEISDHITVTNFELDSIPTLVITHTYNICKPFRFVIDMNDTNSYVSQSFLLDSLTLHTDLTSFLTSTEHKNSTVIDSSHTNHGKTILPTPNRPILKQ
ncbi:unnamed protein product [Rotaria socialis]|uniref:Uncharacterized protein n=1 Tax=Rotaria socialis TaxID=392032 RepID=A0A821N977_9BILA|nr:unnamed protein product [Rotaria socialis]